MHNNQSDTAAAGVEALPKNPTFQSQSLTLIGFNKSTCAVVSNSFKKGSKVFLTNSKTMLRFWHKDLRVESTLFDDWISRRGAWGD